MKKYKAIRRTSTGEYYHWNPLLKKWITVSVPTLMDSEITWNLLKLKFCKLPNMKDAELIDIYVSLEPEWKIQSGYVKNHPLQLLFLNEKEKQVFQDEVLPLCHQSYVLDVRHLRDGEINIHCPMTNFANAYYNIGATAGKMILSARKCRKSNGKKNHNKH